MSQGDGSYNHSFVMSFYQLSLYFTVGLLATFYSSKLIAMTAVRFQSPPFTTIAEVAEQDTYRPVFLHGESTVQDIMASNNPDTARIKEKLISNYTHYAWKVTFFDIQRKLTEEKIAFFISAEYNYYLKQNDENLEILEETYMKSGVHFGYRKEFPLRMIIDKLLIKLRQTGIIKRIISKHFKEKKKPRDDESVKQIELKQIYLPLFILLFGNVTALIWNAISYWRRKRGAVNSEDENN
ncbi:Uncharacterised protein r2_g3505 [Pycnogonum litorale]